MVLSKIKDKEIELFAENEIRAYTRNIHTNFFDMLKVYFNSDGFVILEDEDNAIIGYLDQADIKILRKLFNEYKNTKITVKELVNKNELPLRDSYFGYDHPLLDALQILDRSSQIYFPVMRDTILLGRVSKSIIRERINRLY